MASPVEKTKEVVDQVEGIVFEEVPEIKALWTRSGMGGGGMMGGARFSGPHVGTVMAMLVDQSERNRSSEAIARSLRERLRSIPGTFINVYTGGLVSRIMTFGSEDPIDVEVLGFDLSTGSLLAREVEQILRGVQGVTDIQVGREEGLPEYQVRMRQDRAATMGLTTSRVADVVKTAIEGNESSVYVDPVTGREHIVRVRLAEGDRSKLEDLRRLPIPVTGGKVVALENVAELVQVFSPTQIERKYQQRIVHVTANTSGRDLGSIAQEIEKKISQMKIPEGFTVSLKGARLEQQAGLSNAPLCPDPCCRFDLYGSCVPVRFAPPSVFDHVFCAVGLHRRCLGPLCDRKYLERDFIHRDHHDGRGCCEQCDHSGRLYQPAQGRRG